MTARSVERNQPRHTSLRGWAAVLGPWAMGFGIACFTTHDRDSIWTPIGSAAAMTGAIVGLLSEGVSWRRLIRSGLLPVAVAVTLAAIIIQAWS